MIFIQLTKDPLKVLFRRTVSYSEAFRCGFRGVLEGLIAGARNMVGIAAATGVAGIVVGTISLTGAHQVVGELIEFLSGGRSEEHTSELQSLMSISYAVFCLTITTTPSSTR